MKALRLPLESHDAANSPMKYKLMQNPLYWVYDFLSISKPYKAFWQLPVASLLVTIDIDLSHT